MTDAKDITFLIAEDEIDIASFTPQLLEAMLKNQYGEKVTYHFILAKNGKEAMQAYYSQMQQFPETNLVVITDFAMPDTDGYEFFQFVRAYEKKFDLKNAPVIFNTAYKFELLKKGFSEERHLGDEAEVTPIEHNEFARKCTYLVVKPTLVNNTVKYALKEMGVEPIKKI